MICEQWFSTPIWYDKFKNISEQEYCNAIEYCNFLSTKSIGRKVTNIGGWQSESLYYNDIIGTPLEIFFEQIKPAIGEALNDLGVTRNLKLDNFWVNINNYNDRNGIHDHISSSISGSFYLTDNNSSIVFYRNRDICDTHLTMLYSNKNTNLSCQEVRYAPVRGQYLIFPSWLMHSVEPNTSTEKRISIAFNVSVL
jgi:uncharacterized protein (TIGR02466 family)